MEVLLWWQGRAAKVVTTTFERLTTKGTTLKLLTAWQISGKNRVTKL
jgi:hypothetical protein